MVPWPTRVLNLNDISIGSAIFAGADYCNKQTDQPTDHATRSVTIDCIYAHAQYGDVAQ